MAKTANSSSSARTMLIVSRKELIDQLKVQMERGNQVAKMPVATRSESDYYGRRINTVYDKAQEDAFNNERRKWQQYVEELLKQSFSISNNEYHKDFYETGQSLIFVPGQDYIQDERDEIAKKVAYLESLIERIPLIPSSVEPSIAPKQPVSSPRSDKIFIVHGHDIAVRAEVELLIKKLGYNPIVLFKQASGGKTIIEKLEEETDSVDFAVILYTACDFGRDKDNGKEQPRARQNVVFEHGYLCAKLGRDHVCALVEPGIEVPGDLSGVVYIPLSGPWQYMLAKEMKSAGLTIDMNLL
jgi:Predicted nucleotide-binding protein containing TIR -like domain